MIKRNLGINSGVAKGFLESEGLSEVAFFLKKARHNLEYAMYALEGEKFEEARAVLSDASKMLDDMKKMGGELSYKIDEAETSIMKKVLASREEDNV